MTRITIEGSSAIASIGFGASTLEVEYKHGGVYRFAPVTQAQYDAMLVDGVSVGTLVAAIKADQTITCSRVENNDAQKESE